MLRCRFFNTHSSLLSRTSFVTTNTTTTTIPLVTTTSRTFFGKLFGGSKKDDEGKENKTSSSSSSTDQKNSSPLSSPASTLKAAKDIWNVTKAAKQMAKEAHPEGGKSAFAESQMAQMRAVLELQKKMATQVGASSGNTSGGKLGNKEMAKMMEQSSDMWEKMMAPLEKKLQDKNPQLGAAPEIASAAAAGAKHLRPEQLSQILEKQQQQQQQKSSQQQQQQQQQTPSKGQAHAAATSSNNNNSNNQQQQQQSNNNNNLAPEIEALFSELRQTRKKKNEYRDKCRESEKELQTNKVNFAKCHQIELDLRKRLSSAEHTVTLLQSESLELKDKKNELASQLKTLNAELTKTKPSAASAASQKQNEAELLRLKKQNSDSTNDIERLERKVRRLRRHSTAGIIGDLSELLSEFSRIGSSSENSNSSSGNNNVPLFSTTSSSLQGNINPVSSSASSMMNTSSAFEEQSSSDSSSSSLLLPFRNSISDDAFNSVRDKYEKLISSRFPSDAKECGVSDAIASVALELLRSRLPHSLLDCIVIIPNEEKYLKRIQDLIEPFHGWSATVVKNEMSASSSGNTASAASSSSSSSSANDSSTTSTMSVMIASSPDSETDSSSSTTSLGPYGFFACYTSLKAQEFQQKQQDQHHLHVSDSKKQQQQKQEIITCFPHVSSTLTNNSKRAKILTDKARSSKPGGQASNVCETKITHRLLVDGVLVASAVSQDSRSAMHNKDTAMDRLMKERLPAANHKLRHVSLPRLPPPSSNSEKSQQQQQQSNREISSSQTNKAGGEEMKNEKKNFENNNNNNYEITSSLAPALENLDIEEGELVATAVRFALAAQSRM